MYKFVPYIPIPYESNSSNPNFSFDYIIPYLLYFYTLYRK